MYPISQHVINFNNSLGHRYDCNKEKRRYSVKNKSFLGPYAGDIDGTLIAGLPIKGIKKYVDHSPHAVCFVLFLLLFR